MKALWLDDGGMKIAELPRPRPAAGEALIRVMAAGVCRTDLELARGYMNFSGVPGHEFAGVVEECEDRDRLGKTVTGEINLACGACPFCWSGLSRHCPAREVLGIVKRPGAFAEFLTLPVENLHELPAGMTPETGVFVEPVAACFEMLGQVSARAKRAAVLGDGKLGILAARTLIGEAPSRLVLVGRHPEKLALVERDGIETMLVAEFEQEVAAPDRRFELVVEATGRAEGFSTALAAVRPRGVIVQKSTVAGLVPVDLSRVVVDEVTVAGSRCGPFGPAIAALASGRVRVDDLVTARFPLSRAVEAMEAARAPGALKVLLEMKDDAGP